MEDSNRLKCSECVRAGRFCVNLSWEALDKIREKYRKKVRENEQKIARVINRLLRNKSILQQVDERAKAKIRCFMEKLEKFNDLEEVVNCPAVSFLTGWSPVVWFFFERNQFLCGCFRWKFAKRSWQFVKFVNGSHVFSVSSQPFHLMKYC